jgi:hypothetical protein
MPRFTPIQSKYLLAGALVCRAVSCVGEAALHVNPPAIIITYSAHSTQCSWDLANNFPRATMNALDLELLRDDSSDHFLSGFMHLLSPLNVKYKSSQMEGYWVRNHFNSQMGRGHLLQLNFNTSRSVLENVGGTAYTSDANGVTVWHHHFDLGNANPLARRETCTIARGRLQEEMVVRELMYIHQKQLALNKRSFQLQWHIPASSILGSQRAQRTALQRLGFIWARDEKRTSFADLPYSVFRRDFKVAADPMLAQHDTALWNLNRNVEGRSLASVPEFSIASTPTAVTAEDMEAGFPSPYLAQTGAMMGRATGGIFLTARARPTGRLVGLAYGKMNGQVFELHAMVAHLGEPIVGNPVREALLERLYQSVFEKGVRLIAVRRQDLSTQAFLRARSRARLVDDVDSSELVGLVFGEPAVYFELPPANP